MIFIFFQKKKSEITLAAVCGLMVLITIFLLVASISFSVSKGAPNFFGKSVYLVKTNAFELIKNPSAVVAEKIEASALKEKDVVIFTALNADDVGHKAIGEVAEVLAPSEEVPYFEFVIADETGKTHIITEHLIIAKAVKASVFFGVILKFATSSAGVLATALIPCATILILEVSKPFRRKKEEEIAPVNKQREVPTFVPNTNSKAALKAYKKTAGIVKSSDEEDDFQIPEKPPLFIKPEPKPKPEPPKQPLSSKKLAETMALVKAQRSASESANSASETSRENSSSERSIDEILAAYGKYKEKKN